MRGVFIDPKRVSAIQALSLPRNKKDIQHFLSKIKILRRFIPNYAEIAKDITEMLRKNHEFKWTIPIIYAFDKIEKAISKASILASPNYYEPFNIFSFVFETTLAIVLLQKNGDGDDQYIAFFSKFMRDVELEYDIIEK